MENPRSSRTTAGPANQSIKKRQCRIVAGEDEMVPVVDRHPECCVVIRSASPAGLIGRLVDADTDALPGQFHRSRQARKAAPTMWTVGAIARSRSSRRMGRNCLRCSFDALARGLPSPCDHAR